MTYLISLLAAGEVPYDGNHMVWAELIDGEFRPESVALVVGINDKAPFRYNPFAPFADGIALRDGMREHLWLDYDPKYQPEEEWDIEKNYPERNEVFEPEFLRDACMAMIRQGNAARKEMAAQEARQARG
jgi:hypothetical protein